MAQGLSSGILHFCYGQMDTVLVAIGIMALALRQKKLTEEFRGDRRRGDRRIVRMSDDLQLEQLRVENPKKPKQRCEVRSAPPVKNKG